MKKLSFRHRQHLVRKSRKALRKSIRAKAKSDAIAAQVAEFKRIRDALPVPLIRSDKFKHSMSFDAPQVFDIFENYEETLAFLLDVRRFFSKGSGRKAGRRRAWMADFSTIQKLDPASGLLLAAEIDRWCRTTGKKPVSYDYLWPASLRDYFEDAGMFRLLGIEPKTVHSDEQQADGLRAISYRSDSLTQGEIADAFRAELEELAGEAIGPRQDVYVALSEAMANVVGHAYPSNTRSWSPSIKRRWWLGGSWQPNERVVTVQIYDHGVGIPRTLPKSAHWFELVPLLRKLDPEGTDASLIEAAMQYRRTSTGEQGRGKGMAQMAEWIDRTSQGSLRILSGSGGLTYLPGQPPKKRSLPVDFGGTLIEWKVPL